jgi:hypothetical protein
MTRRSMAVLLGLALLAPAACADDGPEADEARLRVEGEAVVERADGGRDVVTDSADLRAGDQVTMASGEGELELAGGARLELRDALDDETSPTSVVVGAVPVLESGDLLVTVPDRTAVELEADGTSVVVESGAARLERTFGMSVGSYSATVSLDSAGQERGVPALREMTVPGLGRPPQAPRPLAVDEADPWDRRHLGGAIDLGEQLELLAAGLFDNLPPDRARSAEFFRFVLPGLDDEPAFDDDLLDPDRPSAETLVGAAITDLGERGGFDARWAEVFAFRDAGAEWGLVALDQAVDGAALSGDVEEALGVGVAEAEFAAPPPADDAPAPTTPSPTTTAPPPTGPSPTPTTSPPPTAPPPTAPPPTSPPPTVPPLAPPLLDPVVEPVTDLLGGVVDGLLGGLLGP